MIGFVYNVFSCMFLIPGCGKTYTVLCTGSISNNKILIIKDICETTYGVPHADMVHIDWLKMTGFCKRMTVRCNTTSHQRITAMHRSPGKKSSQHPINMQTLTSCKYHTHWPPLIARLTSGSTVFQTEIYFRLQCKPVSFLKLLSQKSTENLG